jgi:hypothetical protein
MGGSVSTPPTSTTTSSCYVSGTVDPSDYEQYHLPDIDSADSDDDTDDADLEIIPTPTREHVSHKDRRTRKWVLKEVGKEMSPGVQPIKPKTTTGRARTPSIGHRTLVKRRALDHRLSSWKRKGFSERIELSLGIVVVDKTWLSEDKAASDIQKHYRAC